MDYFQTLPKVIITQNNTSKVFTNLLARSSIVSSLLTNPLLFYSYDIQENDTPEIIAHKYYKNMSRFWVVLFSNQLLDPQWDWPMESSVFNQYLTNKYPSNLYAVHHYEKIVKKTDNISRTLTTENIIIDEETYNNLVESTETYTLSSGSVTVNITKNIVDNYTYELNLNESKRNIKLLNSSYVQQVEKEFKKLMEI
jgi:hypothetical protein